MNENTILPYLVMVSAKWHVIGILLGISPEDRVNIHGEPEECMRKVTSLWLAGKCSKPPTLETLTDALRNRSVNEPDVAKVIEQGKADWIRLKSNLIGSVDPMLTLFALQYSVNGSGME